MAKPLCLRQNLYACGKAFMLMVSLLHWTVNFFFASYGALRPVINFLHLVINPFP